MEEYSLKQKSYLDNFSEKLIQQAPPSYAVMVSQLKSSCPIKRMESAKLLGDYFPKESI